MKRKPVAIDLYCGLGGWTNGLLAEGWDVVGFDIERHAYGDHRYPAQLVLQDIRTIDGAQFRDASLIVASSPCQEFSWRAMPWKAAKAAPPPLLGMELFAQAERIQREAIEAAGRFIPMIQENVRGAQKYVGRARWHYGSYYLWGDVPALMPITLGRSVMKRGVSHRSNGETNFHASAARALGDGIKAGDRNKGRASGEHRWTADFDEAAALNSGDDSVKVSGARGDDWFTHHNREEFDDRATKNSGGSWFNVAHNTESGKGQNPDGRKTEGHVNLRDGYDHTRHLTNQAESDGVKSPGGGAEGWFGSNPSPMRRHPSGSSARKAASARIAMIPLPLARHIARVYHPDRASA